MKINRKYIYRLFILLFTISVSFSVLPSGIINVHGLFGEVKASTIVTEQEIKEEEIAARTVRAIKRQKGINIYNFWLLVIAIVIYRCFLVYVSRLPEEDTIVTLKIRMDN